MRRAMAQMEEEEEAEREARAGIIGSYATRTVAFEEELSDTGGAMEEGNSVRIGGGDGEQSDGDEEAVSRAS